jgi:hypothetical protein
LIGPSISLGLNLIRVERAADCPRTGQQSKRMQTWCDSNHVTPTAAMARGAFRGWPALAVMFDQPRVQRRQLRLLLAKVEVRQLDPRR